MPNSSTKTCFPSAVPLGYTQFQMQIYRYLFWLCLFVSLACFAAGGWLWYSERDVPLLVVDNPSVDVGTVAAKEARIIEVSVQNTSPHPLRLAGVDGELC
jgi:hypothetical protein